MLLLRSTLTRVGMRAAPQLRASAAGSIISSAALRSPLLSASACAPLLSLRSLSISADTAAPPPTPLALQDVEVEIAPPTRFAIVELSGSQYKVAAGDLICVEKLEVPVGQSIDAKRVLLVGEAGATVIGSPLITGASVKLTVEEQGYGKKVIIFKKQRRKGYRRWRGYRPRLTLLRVGEIDLPEAIDGELE